MANFSGSFKVLEVTGTTKKEALDKAPFAIMGDATQAYKNWAKKQVDGITEASKKLFYQEYLQKKSKCVAGVGYAVTVESAVEDTKLRPYKINDVKREGKRKYKTIYQIVDKNTGAIIGSVDTTKQAAKEYVKKLYTDKGFKGDVVVKYTKQVIDGEPIAFTANYAPSKSSHMGTYVVFGVEA